MKTILIDPFHQTVEFHELPDEGNNLDHLYAAMDCDNVDVIKLGKSDGINIDLWVNGEGLMAIPDGARFFVLHNKGVPSHMIVGKAVVAGSRSGDTCGLPYLVTPLVMHSNIAFIPDANSVEAANIAEEMMDLVGIVSSQEEFDAIGEKNKALLLRALALCSTEAPDEATLDALI